MNQCVKLLVAHAVREQKGGEGLLVIDVGQLSFVEVWGWVQREFFKCCYQSGVEIVCSRVGLQAKYYVATLLAVSSAEHEVTNVSELTKTKRMIVL